MDHLNLTADGFVDNAISARTFQRWRRMLFHFGIKGVFLSNQLVNIDEQIRSGM